jgi:RHS repeat-associated protein
VGGVTRALGYGYNAAGQLAQTVLPSGATIAFGYNTNGQLTSLTLNGSTTILNGITYDPFGPITGWSWGNGTTVSRDFDIDGKVTQVDNANGASLKNYAYDDAFRITGISDAGSSALSWTYGYDSLDRLNAATSTGTTQGWTYDANGNRLTESGSTPSTYTNSATSNRVSSISGSLPRTYGYDVVGNTLSYGTATFTYNNRGRMATATNVGTTATYTYNAFGQRVRRATSSATTVYLYDEAGHLAGEYTSTGALIQETVWLGDIPVATLRPDGSGGVLLYYVHTDHLNTPRLVTDVSNNIRWRWDSDPFGTTQPNQNPSGLGMFEYNLRFPGQQYDAVVGLHYNYFRDYDPAVGRYVESDPIGLEGGLNTYTYVGSMPSMAIDASGLMPGSNTRKVPCDKKDSDACQEDCWRKGGIYRGCFYVEVARIRKATNKEWVPIIWDWKRTGIECRCLDKDTAACAAVLGTILYWTISEGSRVVFPPRNAVPIL